MEGDEPEVVRVDAPAVLAVVVQLHARFPGRQRLAVVLLPDNAMRLAEPSGSTIERLAVPRRITRTSPWPALIVCQFVVTHPITAPVGVENYMYHAAKLTLART